MTKGRSWSKRPDNGSCRDLSLPAQYLHLVCFIFFAQTWRTWAPHHGPQRPTSPSNPAGPRPWYFFWPVMHVLRFKLKCETSPPRRYCFPVLMNSTETTSVPAVRENALLVNFGCQDVSKTTVAERSGAPRLFAKVESEPLMKAQWSKNPSDAAHDGRVLEGPLDTPIAGKTYRCCRHEIDGGLVEDLRCCIVGDADHRVRSAVPLRAGSSTRMSKFARRASHCYSAG